jgi:ribose-phosphate pyrophosphokinase
MKKLQQQVATDQVAAMLQTLVAGGVIHPAAQVALGQQLMVLGQKLASLGSKPKPLVFAVPGYERLAQEIVEASDGWLELGVDKRKRHGDGKGWQCFVTPVAGREVILVGATMSDTDQMEMYKLGYNAWLWKAHKLTFLISYHGDARQERAQVDGESVDGLFASMMFAGIPKCPGGNDVFLVDIHADAVTGFFLGGGMRCRNIEVLVELIGSIGMKRFGGKCMAAAPDAGRAKVVAKAVKKLKWKLAIASKIRLDDKTETAGLIGTVRKRNVILSDDIGVSLGSAIGAANFLKKKGALDVVLLLTHGVIPDAKFVSTLKDSGMFTDMYVTDSLPRVYDLEKQFAGFLHVVPLAPLVVPHLLSA